MNQRSTKTDKNTSTRTLAKALAPEDIRPDYYVALLYVVDDYVSCDGIAEGSWRQVEPTRVRTTPAYTPPPMKVIEVCLPYVLVKEADGDIRTLDVRRYHLARVTSRFGRTAAERIRARKKNGKTDDDDED